jgi:hemoglobin
MMDDGPARGAPQPNPHFDRIGGEPIVAALVEAFYREMDTRLEAGGIRAMHAADLGPVKSVLKLHLVEWLARRYSAQRGHPRLRARHARFAIGPAEREAWLACMDAALEQVVGDAELRAELRAAFRRTANAIVNRPA